MKLDKLLEFFATNSGHSYPALLDVCMYLDCCAKLPEGFSRETIGNLFLITLDMSVSRCDAASASFLFKGWLRFLLKFERDPFSHDVISKIPDCLKSEIIKDDMNFTDYLGRYWNDSPYDNDILSYGNVGQFDGNIDFEFLKFLKNPLSDNYVYEKIPEIQADGLDEDRLQSLYFIFCKYYAEGNYEKALRVLNHFPKNWKTFWNAHLCDPKCNDYIDGLLYMLKKQEDLMEFQNVFIIQLELRKLKNFAGGNLAEDGGVDDDILREITAELEKEALAGCTDDELVDKFTLKLYEKAIFTEVLKLFESIPRNVLKNHKLAIYMDVKYLLEFCGDNGIARADEVLARINRYLFNEVSDSSSGVNLVTGMLRAGNFRGISGYFSRLGYLLEPDSIDMEMLFESLIGFVASGRLEKKQYRYFREAFTEIKFPQFAILSAMLDVFNTPDGDTGALAGTVAASLPLFRRHSQTFYMLCDAVINARLELPLHQAFVNGLLVSPLGDNHIRSLLYVLIEHFYDQQYRDFSKGFDKSRISRDVLNRLESSMDRILDDYFEDEKTADEYQDKFDAIEKCRDFISYLRTRPFGDTAYEY
ncbi:MAG: hypothetical protein JXA66_01870 [Oligoflexia bacterium]|nr:hypothetical protein [Oligoflexia bacterium]